MRRAPRVRVSVRVRLRVSVRLRVRVRVRVRVRARVITVSLIYNILVNAFGSIAKTVSTTRRPACSSRVTKTRHSIFFLFGIIG